MPIPSVCRWACSAGRHHPRLCESCSRCASIIIQSGIRRVVTVPSSSERWAEGFHYMEELFREAGVELVLRSAAPQS